MKKVKIADRLLFLITAILASYQIVNGLSRFSASVTIMLTGAFGVLVLAGLLLLLFGMDVLEKNAVVVIATITPLMFSEALVLLHLPSFGMMYSVFAVVGFLAVLFTRYFSAGKIPALSLAVVHGIAGMMIFLLPVIFVLTDRVPVRFVFVGIGGALMGIGGLLLAFLKSGKPILSREVIFNIFPALLMITTLFFVIGFNGGV